MNSICGILNLDTSPVNPNSLSILLNSLIINKYDFPEQFHKESIAFGVVEHKTSSGKSEKTNFSPETYKNYTIISNSKIFNRKELLNKLSISSIHGKDLSDNFIFLKCFEKWQHNCPNHIQGEWVFALWNNSQKELFIAVSHYWIPTLYYYKSDKTFYFSSSLKSLIALTEIPKKINEFRLGQILIHWNNNLGNTIYENIHPLQPAHSLLVSPKKFEMNRYWALEETSPIRLKKDNDYVEAFREIYANAVKDRLKLSTAPGTTLSGGLDSGSVTALAALELKKSNRHLPAFSSVPLFDVSGFDETKRFADETGFIKATAEYSGNVDVKFIKAENISPVEGLKKYFQIFVEPPTNPVNHYWLFEIMNAAQNNNLDSLLIAQGGNSTVSWKGLFTGIINWAAFFETVNETGTNLSAILKAAKKHLIAPAIPLEILNILQRKRNTQINWDKYSPIKPLFARQQNLHERMKKEGHYDYSRDPRTFQLRSIKPLYGTTFPIWNEMGRHHNLWITDPTVDKRLLEFCTSIPNNQFYRNGTEKHLFKRAFKGIMPDKVIFNTHRGRQAADLQQRLSQDLPQIESLIQSFKKSELCNYYLDIPKIESTLPLVKDNNYPTFTSVAIILLKGIAVGLFLQKFE